MKIKTVLISATILSALALGSSQVTTVYADDNPQQVTTDDGEDEVTNSGDYGDVHWSIDKDTDKDTETLTISGGTITGFDSSSYPAWILKGHTNTDINHIKITGPLTLPVDSTFIFANLPSLEDITGLENVHTQNTKIFDGMFQGDGNLDIDKTLDVSNFDTHSATSMSSMFDGCGAKNIKLSSLFDTSGVTDMSNMFADLPNVTTLDLSNFNTSNVTNMGMMFSTDKKLSKLDLSNFKTPLVTQMDYMFSQSPNLTNLDLSNFTSNSDGSYSYMFQNNTNLKSLNISKLDLSKIDASKQESMFSGVNSLNDVTLNSNNKFADSAGISKSDKQMVNVDTIDSDKPTIKTLSDVLDDTDGGHWAQTYKNTVDSIMVGNNVDENTQKVSVPTDKTMYVGQKLKLKVKPDEKKGFTATDPQTITVNVPEEDDSANPDSQTISTTDKLIYTKKSSGNSHHSSGSHNSGTSTPTKETPKVTDSDQYVTVKHNIDDASLYNNDQDILTNRALAHDSSWFSNKVMTYKGQTYYQVATNEWVKASDVYVYQKADNVVRTKNKEITYLKNISGNTISNRGLAANTDWKADQLVQIDGQAYYRVATNEFVSTNDVTVL